MTKKGKQFGLKMGIFWSVLKKDHRNKSGRKSQVVLVISKKNRSSGIWRTRKFYLQKALSLCMRFDLQKVSGKQRNMYKSYILGVHRLQIILTFQNEPFTYFHATSLATKLVT